MDIKRIENANLKQNFTANPIRNKAFKDVVEYAEKHGKLLELDRALNTLANVNKGEILVIHGKTPSGRVYSNFSSGHRSIPNIFYSNSAEEASYYGFLKLAELGKSFRSLFGTTQIKSSLKAEDLIKKYSVNINI